MSEPEIARRCPACSAMARMSAAFCPHCGATFQHRAVTTTSSPAENDGETIARASEVDNFEPPVRSAINQQDDATPKRVPSPAHQEKVAPPSPAAASLATKHPDSYEVSDERGSRSVTSSENSTTGNQRRVIASKAVAARGQLEENLRPRVAKLKQTSSTVLDEAADDPGLRFVLIAAGLFLLTVVLFMFSKLLH